MRFVMVGRDDRVRFKKTWVEILSDVGRENVTQTTEKSMSSVHAGCVMNYRNPFRIDLRLNIFS